VPAELADARAVGAAVVGHIERLAAALADDRELAVALVDDVPDLIGPAAEVPLLHVGVVGLAHVLDVQALAARLVDDPAAEVDAAGRRIRGAACRRRLPIARRRGITRIVVRAAERAAPLVAGGRMAGARVERAIERERPRAVEVVAPVRPVAAQGERGAGALTDLHVLPIDRSLGHAALRLGAHSIVQLLLARVHRLQVGV
jgi:hypothetical protein